MLRDFQVFRPVVPNLFGTRDRFCGSNFSMDQGWGMVSGRFKHITFKFTSCCAARFLTGPGGYQSVAQRLETPVLDLLSLELIAPFGD